MLQNISLRMLRVVTIVAVFVLFIAGLLQPAKVMAADETSHYVYLPCVTGQSRTFVTFVSAAGELSVQRTSPTGQATQSYPQIVEPNSTAHLIVWVWNDLSGKESVLLDVDEYDDGIEYQVGLSLGSPEDFIYFRNVEGVLKTFHVVGRDFSEVILITSININGWELNQTGNTVVATQGDRTISVKADGALFGIAVELETILASTDGGLWKKVNDEGQFPTNLEAFIYAPQ